MPLTRLLRLLAALLILATALLVGRIGLVEWQQRERAQLGLAAVGHLQQALVAAEMVSRERGPANGVLGDGEPPQPERRARLAEARGRTDAAFEALRQVLAQRPDDRHHQAAAGRLADGLQALQAARAMVDRVAALPRAERSAEALRGSVAAMVAVVPTLAPAVGLLADEAQQALPLLADNVQGARMTAELREYAGLLGSHFTAALTGQRAFSAEERAAIDRTRGRIDQLRHLVGLHLDVPETPLAVQQAWQQVQQRYFDQAGQLVGRVLAAGESDGRYGLDPAGFAAAYVPDMNSMFALRDLLLASARSRAQTQALRAGRALTGGAAASLALLAVLGATLWQVQRRLLQPLAATTQALQALAANDLQAPLPTPEADDEMAAVIGAVRTLQAQTRHKQLLEAERDSLIERLRELSNTDFLTGLPNRRAFMQAAERDLAHAHRHGHPLTLVLLDVDHFKSFNDSHGHAAGDQALVAVAAVVRQHLRATDHAARFGGEEFVLMLQHCGQGPGQAFAERLRSAIAGTPLPGGGGAGPLRLTASLGLASLGPDAADLATLLGLADAAMYRAKQQGRNRVAAADHAERAESPETAEPAQPRRG